MTPLQGDIARINGNLYKIEFMEDTGCNEYVGIDNSERWIVHQKCEEAEIIGNIYENPELLTPSKL